MTTIKRLTALKQALNSNGIIFRPNNLDYIVRKYAAENTLDVVLSYLDTTLSVLDLATLAASASGAAAPVTLTANKIIGFAAGAVDLAQAYICLDNNDYDCVAVNLLTAVISIIADKSIANVAHIGTDLFRSSLFRAGILNAIATAIDAAYGESNDKEKTGLITAIRNQNNYNKVVAKVVAINTTGWIDYPTSDNPTEIKPSVNDVTKQKELDSLGRANPISARQKATGCNPPASTPVSSKFTIAGNTIEYRSGDNVQSGPGLIESSVVVVATSLDPGIKLKDSDWKICRVDRDAEGAPETVILNSVTDSSKYLFVKHRV